MRVAKASAPSEESAFVPLYAPTARYRIRAALKSAVGRGNGHGRESVTAHDAPLPRADVGEQSLPQLVQAETPETETPEAELPEAETPEAELPEAELPEAELPEAETPEAELPEAETPEAELPEAETPEAELPEVELPEVAMSVDPPQWRIDTSAAGRAPYAPRGNSAVGRRARASAAARRTLG